MVVELLDDPVPPWLGRWNEPEIDAVAQAETNKRSHTSWIGWTAEESHLVVHLKILRDAHTQSDRINSVQNALRCTGWDRLYPAPVDCGIDGMQTVETDRAGKVTRADHINLMGLVG